MLEQELKFSVPPSSRKAIAGQIATAATARRTRLRAMYFDTADRQLGRRRAAIRIRQEGRKWVQTFKMAGDDPLSRIELNHPCPKRQLDLSVYAGTPAEAVLAQLTAELAVRYETDVWRQSALLRTRGGTVEVALDIGAIRAGGLELPVHELEFELMSGRPDALFTLARRWLHKHRLVLDLRSKAERGDALAGAAQRIAAAPLDERGPVRDAEIARFRAPRFAQPVQLERRATPGQALDEITAECFAHIARNATLLAAVDFPPAMAPDTSEHVHQLRVGMRRLRSAWKLFEGAAAMPPAGFREAARTWFGDFGMVRDQDVMGGAVVPALLKAGMPPLTVQTPAGVDAASLASATGFQEWLLALLAWLAGLRGEAGGKPAAAVAPIATAAPSAEADVQWLPAGPADPPARHPSRLLDILAPRLRKWHRRLVREGALFGTLDDEARHGLRKLAKRLRYALSFVEPLYGRARIRPYRKKLSALQDVLGEINDLVVARAHYTSLTEAYPQAWFALGWIAARLDELAQRAEQAFHLKMKKPPPTR